MRAGQSILVMGVVAVACLTGCATEKAWVTVSYVVEPDKGLPPGMTSVAVMNSKVNDVTDQKWSELAANMIQDLIQEANRRYGTNLKVADRKHLADTLGEQDMAAAGVTTASSTQAGRGGQVMEVQGLIQSEINVKVETHRGRQTTISNLLLSGGGGGGHGYRYGHGTVGVDTREVETVARNLTVQTSFKMIDSVNNQNWVTYAPEPFRRFDRTNSSPFFGSSQTEAALTPRDQIIGQAVAEGAREFVSRLVPVEMSYELFVESSTNKDCVRGVQLLRADAYEEALSAFKSAVAMNPQDDRAWFGAGVAAEASHQPKAALTYYRRAYGCKLLDQYRRAKDRLSRHLSRIRGVRSS